MPNVALNVGANRILAAGGIPHPCGDPALAPAEERQYRRALMESALGLLSAPVTEQTIWVMGN